MIDYGAAIDSVQKSSKSELSSRFLSRLKFCRSATNHRWGGRNPGCRTPGRPREPYSYLNSSTDLTHRTPRGRWILKLMGSHDKYKKICGRQRQRRWRLYLGGGSAPPRPPRFGRTDGRFSDGRKNFRRTDGNYSGGKFSS